MPQITRKCLFALIVSLLVIGRGPLSQAEGSIATNTGGTALTDKVASVNGTVISREQFDNALGYQQQMAAIRGVTITDEQMPEIKYEVLENLISTELLYQESQKSGIKVDEGEVDAAYEEKKQKAQFSTDAEFEEALKQTNKTIASYRAEIKQGLAIDRFIKTEISDNIIVSDSEAKEYYDNNPGYFHQSERVRASHIIIRTTPNGDQAQKDTARERIEQVLERLRAGDTFESLAREVSEDDNSKDQGGDIGYFSKGQTPQSFEDAAFKLNVGEISDVVETDSGYHIIKLTDKKDAGIISFEEVKSDILDSLKTSKVNSAVNNYIILLRNRSTIETFPIGD